MRAIVPKIPGAKIHVLANPLPQSSILNTVRCFQAVLTALKFKAIVSVVFIRNIMNLHFIARVDILICLRSNQLKMQENDKEISTIVSFGTDLAPQPSKDSGFLANIKAFHAKGLFCRRAFTILPGLDQMIVVQFVWFNGTHYLVIQVRYHILIY
jgi:hypothetical protein